MYIYIRMFLILFMYNNPIQAMSEAGSSSTTRAEQAPSMPPEAVALLVQITQEYSRFLVPRIPLATYLRIKQTEQLAASNPEACRILEHEKQYIPQDFQEPSPAIEHLLPILVSLEVIQNLWIPFLDNALDFDFPTCWNMVDRYMRLINPDRQEEPSDPSQPEALAIKIRTLVREELDRCTKKLESILQTQELGQFEMDLFERISTLNHIYNAQNS